MFEHLGVVGSGMKPLSSFALNQLGNVVSYWQEAKKGNMGPLIAYGLVVQALGGVLSLPFVQEYERARKLLEAYMDVVMPSILEIFSGDNTFLDRLEIGSQDAKDVALYGLPALTGIDLSSSMRSNETLMSLMAAIALGEEDFNTLFPILSATYDTVKAIPTAVGAILGKEGSVGAQKKSIEQLIAGPVGYGIKEARGLNTTKSYNADGTVAQTDMIASGKEGKANRPRTTEDVVAGLLGTKSVEEKRGNQRLFEQTMKEQKVQKDLRKFAGLYSETGNKEYIRKMESLGVDGDTIKNAIENAYYNRNVDQDTRFFMNKDGTVNERKAGGLLNFGVK
jgi:hypothetical protein